MEATINGKPIKTTWGVFLCDGSLAALMTPPAAKSYVTNESRLEHGKRTLRQSATGASLTRMQARDVSLLFAIEASGHPQMLQRIDTFVEELASSGPTLLKVPELPDTVFRLDYLSCTALSQCRGTLGLFTVKFNEANPMDRS